jgi:hypothetical protein
VSIDERLDKLESRVDRLTAMQARMMDVLELTVEAQARHAERLKEHEATWKRIDTALAEATEKLNALIIVVDGFMKGKQ